MPRRRQPPADTAHHDLIALPDQELEVVLRDSRTGAEVRLGVLASLRDLEVIGSAGLHYAATYVNAERPAYQVASRRARAARIGQELWDAAVERCGIEEPRGT
jgi:hypothetical protein